MYNNNNAENRTRFINENRISQQPLLLAVYSIIVHMLFAIHADPEQKFPNLDADSKVGQDNTFDGSHDEYESKKNHYRFV